MVSLGILILAIASGGMGIYIAMGPGPWWRISPKMIPVFMFLGAWLTLRGIFG